MRGERRRKGNGFTDDIQGYSTLLQYYLCSDRDQWDGTGLVHKQLNV